MYQHQMMMLHNLFSQDWGGGVTKDQAFDGEGLVLGG